MASRQIDVQLKSRASRVEQSEKLYQTDKQPENSANWCQTDEQQKTKW